MYSYFLLRVDDIFMGKGAKRTIPTAISLIAVLEGLPTEPTLTLVASNVGGFRIDH